MCNFVISSENEIKTETDGESESPLAVAQEPDEGWTVLSRKRLFYIVIILPSSWRSLILQ